MLVSKSTIFVFGATIALVGATLVIAAPPVVPGTGIELPNVGDDFEDPNWFFQPNFPKSSDEQDEQRREPAGWSNNQRWYEGIKRGCPDVVQRVPTPPGGLEGSEGALLMRTIRSGIPGRPSYTMQQDDFICNVWQRLGQKIPVQHTPSCVVRVFLPPIKTWENRTGATFGFRTSLETHAFVVPEHKKKQKNFWGRPPQKEFTLETYWPGMFIELRSETDRNQAYDTAYWRIRGNNRGQEVRGPDIDVTGWWTLGMSVTPDGMVHYYISKGIEDLTAEDHVTSQFPYGYRAETFKTFFFNVCNQDDGRTKSTDWIIDDPAMYVATAPGVMARTKPTAVRK
jgi:hypothetical protein